MPVLPSGRRFGVSDAHILVPGTLWFECPEGHFWYQTPDLAINAPPFHPEQQVVCDVVHAPCPSTLEEAERFVAIIESIGEDHAVLTGMWLDQSTRPDGWTEEDWRVWCEWRRTPAVQEFVRNTLERCKAQAEANIGMRGPVRFTEEVDDRPEEIRARELSAARRAVSLIHEIQGIEADLRDPERYGSREALAELHERAGELHQEIRAMLDDPMHSSLPEAWHGLGMVSRLLGLHEEAERAFVEASRLAPFQPDVWLELTRIRSELGDEAGAEVAARRAVELDPDRSQPWANLSMILLKRGRFAESGEAVRRALEIDPEDHVAQHVDRYLRARDGG